MLDELQQMGGIGRDLDLAIWFHDAIYDSKSKDNEEMSSQLAMESIRKIGLTDRLGHSVISLIMTTKHTAQPTSETAQLLVDLDLMVLGKSEQEFDLYEEGIRKEYDWVPEPDFCAGRASILQSFLDRPSIYSTELFRSKYESAARANLKRSLNRLQK